MHPLWSPSDATVSRTQLTAFIEYVNQHCDSSIKDDKTLYDWSVQHINLFWSTLWDVTQVISSHKGPVSYDPTIPMEQGRFFPEAQLNYAQNLLRPRPDETPALIFWGEDQEKRSLSFGELRHQVSCFQHFLKQAGVRRGDRVAGFLPNLPETVVAMLATTSLGAIWTSCSPDFGPQGVLDRFGQTTPKVLLTADGYFYGGKWYSSLGKIRPLLKQLPSVTHLVVIPYGQQEREPLLDAEISYSSLMTQDHRRPLIFEHVPFRHPLFILYSSGTTGVPKGIVHGHGGTLLQLLKEHQLHCDIRPQDRVFYFTTCGWMMWNWLATALASQATLMLYDGSPTYPRADFLFSYAQAERFTFFGTSAKYIDYLRQASLNIKSMYSLPTLRMIASTGSPLSVENFQYVYDHVASDICLASIAGGTDIVSCFALGNPRRPVWAGELQTRGFGMKVEVFDDNGQRASLGQKGELVCTAAFPSMPVAFWNDPLGQKYHDAYFTRFPNVWHHGDYVELTPHGGLIIHGRSDATLNPGGVRIGTAEIYRQVSVFSDVIDCLAVGQQVQGDTRIVLFVRLKEGLTLTDDLRNRLKQHIKTNTTPRHVPALILQVPDIPRTLNGKLIEKAVTDVIHGRPVQNIEAIANPECLRIYKELADTVLKKTI